MLNLKRNELNNSAWKKVGISTVAFNVEEMRLKTLNNPKWIHFGAGNIFRAFPCAVLQGLLDAGIEDTGIIVAEGFDREIIEKIYRPYDNLSLVVTLKSDGSMDKRIVASVAEAFYMDTENGEFDKLKTLFQKRSLQMASFTITEKGYAIYGSDGRLMPDIVADIESGPKKVRSYMGKVAALCYERYQSGAFPIAMVSMDNFSHNGDKLCTAMCCFAEGWETRGLVAEGFAAYIKDQSKITFPWSMIDKITPRPDNTVKEQLEKDGIQDMIPVITAKNTYIAPFVNAEECQYLIIEDTFPAGRPQLEKGGVIFTDRETVDKVERMKVCTCLNPLHTALAIFGCLLSYNRIYEELKNPVLLRMVERIGYEEGLPVVVDPEILNPKDFLRQVLELRLPNPYIPDTPQRIATDTSQKLSIRFGETIKAYMADPKKEQTSLQVIPMVFAGWCRYLLGVDDFGENFQLSPDPLCQEVKAYLDGVNFEGRADYSERLRPILSDERIFGVNLYDAGLAEKVCTYFNEMTAGIGAVRKTLEKYIMQR